MDRIQTEESVRKIVSESFTYADCLVKLGKVPKPYNYYYIKNLINKYSLDISHFTRKNHNTTPFLRVSTEEYLENKRNIEPHKLKLRLVQEGKIEYKCSSCGIVDWLNQTIPLFQYVCATRISLFHQ